MPNTYTIAEDFKDKLLGQVCGGYVNMDWGVFDSNGNPTTPHLQPGNFIVAENYYGYAILRVNENNMLAACDWEA